MSGLYEKCVSLATPGVRCRDRDLTLKINTRRPRPLCSPRRDATVSALEARPGDPGPVRLGQADDGKARELHWKPMSWLGILRHTTVDDAWAPAIWQTFFTSTLGLEVPVLSSLPCHHNLPAAKCGCKKFLLDVHGDHISTCTAHSGATKAHDWMVGRLGPRFRTAGHGVRTQYGVSTSAENRQKRGDVETTVRHREMKTE